MAAVNAKETKDGRVPTASEQPNMIRVSVQYALNVDDQNLLQAVPNASKVQNVCVHFPYFDTQFIVSIVCTNEGLMLKNIWIKVARHFLIWLCISV